MSNITRFRKRPRWDRGEAYGAGRRGGRAGWARYLPLWAGAIGIGLFAGTRQDKPLEFAMPSLPRFGLCHVGGGRNCVVDGDTFWMDGQKIRIAGIDAPETHPSRCAYEEELGGKATRRLRELLNGGRVELVSIARDRDRYGRLLRNVRVNRRDVGDVMIAEGLVRPYGTGRRPWC